ncbi:Alpha/Beta hydrolase protein [Xylariaceae sp. FL1272]|nr:Alpha/Beta hydrolase protein [Xylariaceae sp. FL1272]
MMKMANPEDLKLEYEATFTDSITPFTINVHDSFLKLTNLKVSLTRFVDDVPLPGGISEGVPTGVQKSIASYWSSTYDWRQVEASINSKLTQFTTIIHPSPSPANYTTPAPLHFVHHRSPRSDAIPLLFVHGWPGSFLEVEPIISSLTDPPNASLPAFHVVAPSIPGYGFSPAPRVAGFGYRAAGATFRALMLKLGYIQYVFQGGDAGDFINRYAAHDFPSEIVSGHSNFWVIPPSDSDRERYRRNETTDDENYVIERLDAFYNSGWAYAQIQQTRPLKLAGGMMDSPMGLAMWIYDSISGGNPGNDLWTYERIITWTMMHWINGPFGAFSLYRNGAKVDGAIDTKGINLLPYVSQPVAISQFPRDIWYRTPLEWALRGGNVKVNRVHGKGGHFATLDATGALLDDVWKFFGNGEVSNTKVFKNE